MKELQNGRSMIEMLGVLAIIGVLSIGGLAGYTTAMNRHRANTILDYVSRCVVVAQTYGDGSRIKAGNCGNDGTNNGILGSEKKPTSLSTDAEISLSNNNIKVTGTASTSKIAKALKGRSTSSITITQADEDSGEFTIEFKNVGEGLKEIPSSGTITP